MMKKIGFIDYYISEWHANNYPAWIKKACENSKTKCELCYVWAEKDVSPVDGRTTDEWCKEFGAEKCASIEELCEKSDYIMILAPSDPDKHLSYAEKVLPFGKNTYIDKTFAPDYETAKKIFDIAEKYGTKFFSTSALRFADELTPLIGKCDTLTVAGSGATFDEYGVHVAEMTVKAMGTQAVSVRAESACDQIFIRIKYADGRISNIFFDESYGTPFILYPCVDGKTTQVNITSPFFENLIKGITEFYETGKTPFDVAETLAVMKLRDAIIKAINEDGKWVAVK